MSKKGGLTASAKKVDPTLNALFASSLGPVQAPPKSRYAVAETSVKPQAGEDDNEEEDDDDDDDDDDENLSEASQELDYEDDEDEESGDNDADSMSIDEKSAELPQDEEEVMTEAKPNRDRKRKRKDDNDDLEDKYLSKLVDNDTPEHVEKRSKINANKEDASSDDDEVIPQHESLNKDTKSTDLEKADRTVFLANVSTDAISSKSAKRTLLAHLASILDKDASPAEKVESIRFRSVAFAGGAMPKRAAYITKQLMDATTKSANAYAVYSNAAAARKAAKDLNGTEVLGRHLRVDSVAHPTPTDHRRCVFVGNLGFVDDETVLNTGEDGQTVEKKRNKVPADIEEGLWRTFGTQGKIENVRVVRDPKTRVGKGFAYVQFYDANAVEAALHLEGKKFPPMLPRALRVSRAKDPRKTALAQERASEKKAAADADGKSTKYKKKLTPEERSMVGRAGKLLGRAGASAERRRASGKDLNNKKRSSGGGGGEERGAVDLGDKKSPEQIVFEGMRASSKYGKPNNLRLGKKVKGKKGGKTQNRGAKRAAEWRKKKN